MRKKITPISSGRVIRPAVKLERMEKNLQQLAIQKEISTADFKEHRTRIETARARLNVTADTIKQRQHLVKANFELVLQLASERGYPFRNGNFDEKHWLRDVIFKRLR